LKAGAVRREQKMTLPGGDAPDFRMSVHRMADEVVRWATGTPGIAASRIAFVANKRVYRVDSDGADLAAVSPSSDEALSPAWSPDGQRLAYTQFVGGHRARGPWCRRPTGT
jgi:TolB protein